MKKLLIAAMISTAIFSAPSASAPAPASAPDVTGLYSMTAAVVGLDYEKDIVTLEDSNGFTWTFSGCEDNHLDDVMSLIMWDNGTEQISDDVILDIKYSGYTAHDFH